MFLMIPLLLHTGGPFCRIGGTCGIGAGDGSASPIESSFERGDQLPSAWRSQVLPQRPIRTSNASRGYDQKPEYPTVQSQEPADALARQ